LPKDRATTEKWFEVAPDFRGQDRVDGGENLPFATGPLDERPGAAGLHVPAYTGRFLLWILLASSLMSLAERVARRWIATIALDDRMKALLLKLRKGADSTLSLPQLFKVLELLGGWRVEEIIGLVPMHFKSEGKDRKELLAEDNETLARVMYDKLRSEVVTSLPTHPQEGRRYVMDLEDLKSWENQFSTTGKVHGATYNAWFGAPGWRFTDPEGHTFELLPGRWDLPKPEGRDRKKLRPWDVLRWLKKDTTYLAQINELLGTEPHEKAAPRTRENTGTCGACLRNIKLVEKSNAPPTMALHGYNRPGHGYVVGKCLGGNHPPYELSAEATKAMVKIISEKLHKLKKTLAYLEGNPDRFTKGEKVILKSDMDEAAWDYEVKKSIEYVKWDMRFPESDFKAYTWLVANWKERPLPQAGTKHIEWYDEAMRHGGKEAALILRVAQRQSDSSQNRPQCSAR
jgi:hypothetical protein